MLAEERAVGRRSFPPDDVPIDSPGLYAWYVDEVGAETLSNGIGEPVASGLVYAGQTSAVTRRSGRRATSTLRRLVGDQQFEGSVRASNFRFTLGAVLQPALLLVVVAPKRLTLESEHLLSTWIRRHLRVAICDHEERETLPELESAVLRDLDPPLNVEALAATRVRAAVAAARTSLARADARFQRRKLALRP